MSGETETVNAETLNCPTCGAAASTDATRCLFCDARLATVACPRCFAMMFAGSLHCSHCGAQAERVEAVDETKARRCPRCRVPLESVAVGSATLRECARCGGLWVDVTSFEQIVSEREEQSTALGAAAVMPKQAGGGGAPDKVRYVPCPECGQLMNRVNFARSSGVVVDVCKGDGTWFDRDELRRIVEFIRGGGLEASRAREKREIEEERRRLRQEQHAATLHHRHVSGAGDAEDNRSSVIRAARELLKLMLD
jgi:Zn-finger nucleic acid-binding protein